MPLAISAERLRRAPWSRVSDRRAEQHHVIFVTVEQPAAAMLVLAPAAPIAQERHRQRQRARG
jgi:hypothetical protein